MAKNTGITIGEALTEVSQTVFDIVAEARKLIVGSRVVKVADVDDDNYPVEGAQKWEITDIAPDRKGGIAMEIAPILPAGFGPREWVLLEDVGIECVEVDLPRS